ncbi:hypothetical protein GKZ28_14590 [Clostridium chromiireducens]|uniref:Uncharacterized protein n=1 Tax=Clostridium chromiireducens TaxID=225345 RepID=A0A964RNV4_9CLOT|nr:hypothetical protein [Clostridium chromiireducens]MVX64920.1 hypothetical protein [Clostridium chromiireducens]
MASMFISATAVLTSTTSSTKNSARSYGDNKGSFKIVLDNLVTARIISSDKTTAKLFLAKSLMITVMVSVEIAKI